MPKIASQRRVDYTPEQMFDLVADIENYPHFVPMCETLLIRSRRKREDGSELVTAAMTIGYKLFRETFTSRVTLDRTRLAIIVTYVDGPLQSLENCWSFTAIGPRGCLVDFKLSYELRSRTLAMIMGSVFDRVFGRFAEAFERRAHAVYGSPTFAG